MKKTCHLERDGLEGRAGRGGRGGQVGKKAKGGNRVEMDGTASRVVADSRDESGTGAQPGTGNLVWMSPVAAKTAFVWASIQKCKKKTVFTQNCCYHKDLCRYEVFCETLMYGIDLLR